MQEWSKGRPVGRIRIVTKWDLRIHIIFHRRCVPDLARWMPVSGLFARLAITLGHVGKPGGIVQKCQLKTADWAIALLGNNDLGAAPEGGVVLLVNLFAENK